MNTEQIITDKDGILVSSWIKIHPQHRPTVFYEADGELLDAYIMPDYPEYASLVFADYSVSCSADGTWLDFVEDSE